MAEQRLPIVDGDDGAWGDILNQFLEKEHYNTGVDNASNGGHKNITLRPGTTAAGTAPLKFTSGSLMTAPEAGAVEYLSGTFYIRGTDNLSVAGTITGSNLSGTNTGDVVKASSSELNTGTDDAKFATALALKGSNYNIRVVAVQVLDGATPLSIGNGKAYVRIDSALNGMNLVLAHAQVITKSTSGTPTIMITRGRQASATSDFTYVSMLSTSITIDANEYDSKDAATQPAINTSNDDVATGDVIRIDITTAGTGTAGLNITLQFKQP